MRLADLVINFLAVRAEFLRHVNGVEAELKEIYQRHIHRVQDYTARDADAYASPTSSLKKAEKVDFSPVYTLYAHHSSFPVI